jgi:RNA polymerase sigma factor (sigma-70 family)
MSLMPELEDFQELVRRARDGEEDAAARLAREFQPFILRFARIQMRNLPNYRRLRVEVDSADICQTVFKSLFKGLRKQRFTLDQRGHLEKLLFVMIKFKIATKAGRLSVRLREILDADVYDARIDTTPSPEKPVVDNDLYEAIVEHFSEDEFGILTRRLDGQPWTDIAATLGGTQEAMRKKLERAIKRVRDLHPMHEIFED